MNVQFLEKNGQPEYAVLPIADFNRLSDDAEMLHDIKSYDASKQDIVDGNEEFFPADLIERLMIKESNPIMEYRKYRKMTQAALAKSIGVQQAAIAQFETGKREPLARQLQKLAEVLKVDIEMLLPLA